MLGSIFIATGELLFVFLELRRRVARIDRTLRRLADRTATRSRAAWSIACGRADRPH